jgi:hypothetical protein
MKRSSEAALPGILEGAGNKLSGALRVLLLRACSEMKQFESRIDQADAAIRK